MGTVVDDFCADDSCETTFRCLMCGHCCEGSGGIVTSDADLERLCVHLGLDAEVFERNYGERRGKKLHIRSRDGACVFFIQGLGCSVHPAKPDICRAWPYFRGNLVDPESRALAAGFCPGIDTGQAHADFVREGLAYLKAEGLTGRAGSDEAGALQVTDIAAPLKSLFGKGER